MVTGRKGATAAAVIVALGLLVGACGGGGGSAGDAGGDYDISEGGGNEAPAGQMVEISGKEFSYSPDVVTVPAGGPVTIVLDNIGTIEHDITVDEADFKLTANAGKEATKALTADTPGTYKFYCSIPGHEAAGMKGELIVE